MHEVMNMKKMLKKTLFVALFLFVSFSGFGSSGHERTEKLPGRSIAAGQLPDTVRRFVVRHFANPNQFTYRSDRSFYYVCNEAGGYYLFSGKGAILGFRFCMCQPSHQIIDLLPETVVAHIRESYPGYFLCAFLPEGEGYRVELFGKDGRTLRFDRQGRFLREE